MLQEIHSHDELVALLKKEPATYVLMLKSGSEASECARAHLQTVANELSDKQFYFVDVQKTRDIHPVYGINSVPTFLVFKGEELINTFKGCNSVEFFKNIIEGHYYQAQTGTDGEKPQKRVTVYTTPSCPWCNRLKAYLNKKGIRFTEVNVAADARAAEELVRRTGQQGVPQTEIDGEWVIGFDQKRIDQLLNL